MTGTTTMIDLVHDIGNEVFKQTCDGLFLTYLFEDYPTVQYGPFLTITVGHHQARFTVVNNNVEIAILHTAYYDRTPKVTALLRLVSVALSKTVMAPLMSRRRDSVPPVLLFTRQIRRFFDDLEYLLLICYPNMNLRTIDMDNPFRLPELFTTDSREKM